MKETNLKFINKARLKRKTKEALKKQVELFYNGGHKKHVNDYKIGDDVILNNSLIHGTRADLKGLEKISESGIIASEFYMDVTEKKKKPHIVEFWYIPSKMDLKKWMEKYANGVTIDFYNNRNEIYKRVITSFEDVKSNIKKESGFRGYMLHQNQEQRFVPNDIVDGEATVAFILTFNEEDELLQNDVFNDNFDKSITKDLLPRWFYRKYLKNKNFDNYETGREKGFIFGVPASMIEGIMVSKKIEKDPNYIKKLKKLFPSIYICNINGKVIY